MKSLLTTLVSVILVVATGANAQCAGLSVDIPTNGSCQTYPTNGLCGPILGGQSVFVPFPFDFEKLELIAATLLNTLEANKGIVSRDCRLAGDALVCHSVFLSCRTQVNNEAIPALPCRSMCEGFWGQCQAAFDAFFVGAIQGLGQPASTFSFPHCGPTGTWTLAPQEPDKYGNRSLPGLGPYPKGYLGQLRYPETVGPFKRNDNSIINEPCKTFSLTADQPLALDGFSKPIACPFPLVEEAGECKIPCPFPVIKVEEQDQIGLAFVIPALIALIFCLFVFADSCFVIAESQGFNDVLRRQKRFLMFRGGSTTDTDDGTGTSNGKSGAKRRRNALRAATLYSLLGASLGIVYFCIGPLMTLIRKSDISCGTNADQNLDLLQFVLGQAERTDGFCAAQRLAPFILQMVFNLILYAIVRVFMVVTERARKMSKIQTHLFDILLMSYCAGIPILFMIVAASKDKLSNNLTDFITQFSRNSAICVMRLTVADEVILIFMPFIITGVAICALSYYIYTHLSIINQNVQGIMSPGKDAQKSSSAVALRLLMIRLSFLGVFTFIVLIVFISATGQLMASMAEFAPRFNAFFLCTATAATTCATCEAERVLMLDKLPPSSAFAAQIAAMSSITLLFGGFFAAQSAARLYKEYQDGSLKIKVVNLWYGRPANFGRDKLESSFQSFSGQDGPLSKLPDAVKESCATLFCMRVKRFRDSMRDGRARGQVFRWVKGKHPPPKPRKTGFAVAQAWTSSPKTDEKSIKWQGIVGVPDSSTDPSGWSSSNSQFAGHQPSVRSPAPSGPVWGNQDASWGYSESKLASATQSASVFDAPGNSATRKDQFQRPPTLPEI